MSQQAFYLQCNISLQDCDALYPRATSQQVPFTNGSCVRDPRIPGNVGRCGWEGAQCSINDTVSNCASPYTAVCQNGKCVGGVSQPCVVQDGRYACNTPVACNITVGLGPGAVCGGEGAVVSTIDGPNGLNFGLDYCVSGNASEVSSQYWVCTAGPDPIPPPVSSSASATGPDSSNPTAIPTASAPKTKVIGPIAGGAIGGLLLCSLLVFWWYRKRTREQLLLRPDAWRPGDESQEPAPLLHRRGLSEQSQVTTSTSHSTSTSQSNIPPQQLPEMRSVALPFSRKIGLHARRAVAAPGSTSTETTESSDLSSQLSHLSPALPIRKVLEEPRPIFPAGSSAYTSSTLTLSQGSTSTSPLTSPPVAPIHVSGIGPSVSFMTSPTRTRPRVKSRNTSNSSVSRFRLGSPSTRTPDSPPISAGDVEQRLLELRNEAERGLAELRAQRTGSASGHEEMPPPYHDSV